MPDKLRRGLSWGLLAICLVLTPAGLFLYFGKNGNPADFDHVFEALLLAPLFLVFPLFGTLIITFRPKNIEGLVFSFGGLAWLLQITAGEYAIYGLAVAPGSLPAAEIGAWLYNWLWVLQIGLLTTFALLLFPTGQIPGPRWRIVAWLAGGGLLVTSFAAMVTPGELEDFSAAVVQNPVGVAGIEPVRIVLLVAGLIAIAVSSLASAASLFVRLRRSQGVERQQMKWFAFAAGLAALAVVVTIIGYAVSTETGEKAALSLMTFFGLPVAAGIAILRYRLYEVDVLINRTLVYVSLTAILAGLYAASIQLFKFVFEAVAGGGSQATIVLTTLVLAALFTPVKNFLQSFVDRYFGRLPEPRKEIVGFAEQLRLVTRAFDPEQTLPKFLGHALRITSAAGGAIYLTSDGQDEPFTASGSLDEPEVARVPLATAGEEIGWLVLRGNEAAALSSDDRELLQEVANVVGETVALAKRAGRSAAYV
jgi:hypothetical protein